MLGANSKAPNPTSPAKYQHHLFFFPLCLGLHPLHLRMKSGSQTGHRSPLVPSGATQPPLLHTPLARSLAFR